MLDVTTLEQQLRDLDVRREDLDARLRDAVNRQRYAQDPDAVEVARQDEQAVVTEMDRLMTRIRAVEAKLLLLRKGGTLPIF